ncbi:hypothetical protein SANTM175S_08290 [Streptomyces antimycoticus]
MVTEGGPVAYTAVSVGPRPRRSNAPRGARVHRSPANRGPYLDVRAQPPGGPISGRQRRVCARSRTGADTGLSASRRHRRPGLPRRRPLAARRAGRAARPGAPRPERHRRRHRQRRRLRPAGHRGPRRRAGAASGAPHGFGTAVDEAVRAAPVPQPRGAAPYLKRPTAAGTRSTRTWRDDERTTCRSCRTASPSSGCGCCTTTARPSPTRLAEMLRVVDTGANRDATDRRPQAARLVRPQAAARSRRLHRQQRPPLDRPGPPRAGPGPARPGPHRAVRVHRRHADPPRRLRGARRLRPHASR